MKEDESKPVKREQTAPERRKAGGGALVPAFVRAEKNLAAIGFFTATSNKTLKTPRVKTVKFPRSDNEGERVETSIRIVSGGDYGLPGTADLDKYLAFMQIVNDMHAREGRVTNPVSFTSYEMLALLGINTSGKNYKSIEDWLDRMYATTIEGLVKTTGAAPAGGRRAQKKERVRVFDRVVSVGREVEEGVFADRNHVWFAEWQLESINSNFLIPIDWNTYRALKNSIAKNLVPLLQIYLFASRSAGYFVKSYEELCQLLGIKVYPNESLIRQKLGRSLDELKAFGYLSEWTIERLRRGSGFKLVLHHGEKFLADAALLSRRPQAIAELPSGLSGEESGWVAELVKRGVLEETAVELVVSRADGQHVGDQVEWIDHLIETTGREKYRNAPGMYVSLIQKNAPVPRDFEPSRVRTARAEGERAAAEERSRQESVRAEYVAYTKREIASYIEGLSEPAYGRLLEEAERLFEEEIGAASKSFKGAVRKEIIESFAERLATPRACLLSFEEYAASSG